MYFCIFRYSTERTFVTIVMLYEDICVQRNYHLILTRINSDKAMERLSDKEILVYLICL
jgi:DNA-binding LacI/PurR family transcriptional regulator